MKRFVSTMLLILAAILGVTSATQSPPPQAQEQDPWAPFEFLIGSWSALASGQPGEAISGSTTFSFGLDKKVLIRNNRAEYAAKPGEKAGLVHEDLLIVYRQPGESQFRAVYFDNEGHIINYTIAFPGKQVAVVFETENNQKSPRFRLIYEAGEDGVLSVDFLVAPPGGELKFYVKGILKRRA